MNFNRIEGSIDVARAMQARDWKGFGTGFQLQNGVITLGSGGAWRSQLLVLVTIRPLALSRLQIA